MEEAGISLDESGFSNTSLTHSPQSVSQGVVVDNTEDAVQMEDSSFIDHSNDTDQYEGQNENGGSPEPDKPQPQHLPMSEVDKPKEGK